MEQVNWKGKSGRRYTFEVHPLNAQLEEVECVYIYTKIINDYHWACIYIGESSQLKTRLKQHSSGSSSNDKCIQTSGATHIHMLRLKSESERQDIESDLRSKLPWICNIK